MRSRVVASSFTDSSRIEASTAARPSSTRWKALSWALRYGHRASPGEQDDAEAARQVIGQMESPAAGKVDNERGERVAGMPECRAGHTQLAPAPAAGLTCRRRASQVWVLCTMTTVNPWLIGPPRGALG
jgi:hypothetical protein